MIRQDSTNSYTREIRVFISSTFSDMQAERDYLIKKIFPRFARDCRDYNVVFTPLDLRWGITEEESRSGKVVEICLNEIDRTRPYFIGIVGPRYGWVPSQDDTDDYKRLAQKFPWIEQAFAEGKSITEMEMYYGALKDNSQSNALPDTDGERIAIRTAVDEVISGQKSLMRLFVEQLSLLHPEIDKPEITEYDELKFRDYVKLYPHSLGYRLTRAHTR